MMKQDMTPLERRVAISAAGLFALRMIGLFMILPVFALYGEGLEGSTPLLVGLAIGIYGLTQALLQIPFGMLSDRFGRKPMIAIGLLIFAVGSVVAAMADSIVGVIIGRALQGGGAIAAVIMAMTADLTREEHRTKAMAMIGMTIGSAFAISLAMGPVLNNWIGVDGIFWLTAVLALSGLVLLKYGVPQAGKCRFHRDAEASPSQFKDVLKNGQLLRLDFGIFILHMILTASFVVMPLALRDHTGVDVSDHWQIYLGVMLLSFIGFVPLVILAEKYRKMKQVFVAATLLIGLAQAILVFAVDSYWAVFITLLLFFIAFNALEATLPSWISKTAPADKKGTAMGVYSSAQFFGAFVGGVTGGWIHQSLGLEMVFLFCAVSAGIWALVAVGMKAPPHLRTYMINVGAIDSIKAAALQEELKAMTGVAEAIVVSDDGIAYLKVDNDAVDWDVLYTYSIDDVNEN